MFILISGTVSVKPAQRRTVPLACWEKRDGVEGTGLTSFIIRGIRLFMPVRAAALRMCFGLALAGLCATPYTAKSEEGFWAPILYETTIPSAISNTDTQHTYLMNAGIALSRSENISPSGTGFGNALRLHGVVEPKQQTLWSTEEHWKIAPVNERISLSALLRYETKNDQITIKPRRHSIWFEWRKSFE